MKSAFVGGILLLALVHVSLAQKPATSAESEWEKIGETNASLKTQTGSIAIKSAGRFAAIKMISTDASIEIDKLLVFYENGALQEIDVNNDLKTGEPEIFDVSARIDIQKVSFHYTALPNHIGEKALVELYGLKPDAPADAYRDEDRENSDGDQSAEDLRSELEQAAENVEEDVENAEEKINPETARKQPSMLEETGGVVPKTGPATITDPLLASKVGPEGQDIYLDKDDKCYYINEEGEKVYVGKNKLRDKLRKD